MKGNLMLAKEIIENCNKKYSGSCMIMMDFMKSYDQINREIIDMIMRKMNFGEKI